MLTTTSDSNGLRKSDWQFWFRMSLIATLIAISCKAQAQEQPALPLIEPAETVNENTEPADTNSPPILRVPEPQQPIAPELAENPTEEAVVDQPVAEKPAVEMLPAPQLEASPEIKAGANEVTPLRRKRTSFQGQMLPLPTDRTVPANTIPEIQNETVNVSAEEVAPQTLPNETDAAEDRTETEISVRAEQIPAAKSSQWVMLITPGQSSDLASAQPPALVTFELDPETGLSRGEPQQELLGLAAVLKHQEAEARESSATAKFPEIEATAHTSAAYGQPGFRPAVADYKTVYNAIPYSRAEYLANPGYRHEATMEFLFGEMRPTTIHKQDTPRRIYNLPPLHEGPLPRAHAGLSGWHSPFYNPTSPYWWTSNSTYRRSPTIYGPLFHYYHRPLIRPWGWGF